MMYLLIGPTGVGKTSLGVDAIRSLKIGCFHDLDVEVEKSTGVRASQYLPLVGDDVFLRVCRECIKTLRLTHSSPLCLVAVGAGALQSKQSLAWLSDERTITVTAPPEEVHRRSEPRHVVDRKRSLGEFIHDEFSPFRKAIYDAAKYTFRVDGMTEQEAQI